MKRSVLQSTENCSPIVKSRLDVRQNGRVPSTKFSQSRCTSTSNHPLAFHFVQLRVRSRADNNLLTMVFSRPSSLPIPTTWLRFSVCNTNLIVQDLTDDLLEPAVQLLAKYFTADEPPCKYIEVQKHPVALAELEKLWRNTIKDKLSVVCVKEDDPSEIIGVNVLTVVDSTDKDEAFKSEDAVWWQLFGAVEAVSRSVDVFRVFSVDRYLTAYGLVVAPAWRGRGVAGEILRARVPLCKALGVKVTATVFTAAASQAVAKKAGFQELYKISYEELSEKGFTFPGIEADTKYSKLMALEI